MKTAKEKMVVFRCKGCIEDLQEYNPYINKSGEPIALENIICVEVPMEICENTTFELKPILLDREWYRDLSQEEKVLLVSRAIQNAISRGCKVNIKVWQGYYEREEGLPDVYSFDDYMEDYKDGLEDGEELSDIVLSAVDYCYDKGGCVEIAAEDDENEYIFYHQDVDDGCFDEYLVDDLFEFLEET